MNINDEDLDMIRRAAASTSTTHIRTAAIARGVLAALGEKVPQADGPSLSDIEARVSRIEEALRDVEVPDLAGVEATVGGLDARLKSLEEDLGTADEEPKRTRGKRAR